MIEAIEPNYAVFTLTAVGTKIAGLEPCKALELAQRLVDRDEPSARDPDNYIGNVYTRPELHLLSINYLTECGLLTDNHIDTHEDKRQVDAANNLIDEYWSDIFPNPIHIRVFEQALPELAGKPEDIRRAKPIRRNRLIDICVLRQSIKTDNILPLQELIHEVCDLFLTEKHASFWLNLHPSCSTREIVGGIVISLVEKSQDLTNHSDEQSKRLKDLAQEVASSSEYKSRYLKDR
jgi:hypothetical protein